MILFDKMIRIRTNCSTTDFIQPLIDETLRSRATAWQNGRLMPIMPYTQLPAGWPQGPTRPVEWSRLTGRWCTIILDVDLFSGKDQIMYHRSLHGVMVDTSKSYSYD